MNGGEDIEDEKSGRPLAVLSFRHLDEVIGLVDGAGWRVIGARRLDERDVCAVGAAVTVVERGDRLIDRDASSSMERKKREGYF